MAIYSIVSQNLEMNYSFYIENKSKITTKYKIKSKNFRLRVDSLDFNAVINDNSNIT